MVAVSADEQRQVLEAEIWRILGEYTPTPRVHHVDRLLAVADRYRHAAAGEDDLAGHGYQPRVHWRGTLTAPGTACRPAGRGAQVPVTADPGRVTCSSCRHTTLWADAYAATAERTGRTS